jgi:hypothetical protein
MASEGNNNAELKRISQTLRQLEKRIARIESVLETGYEKPESEEEFSFLPKNLLQATDTLEIRIGQYWFAKAGIVVLAIGIIFLLTFPYKNLPPAVPSLIGYVTVGIIFFLSYIWRKSLTYLSRYLLGGGLILLYFSTLRLHYFSVQSAVSGHILMTLLLLAAVSISLITTVRLQSPYFGALSLSLGYITAIMSGYSYAVFVLLLIFSVISVLFKLKYQWNSLMIYSLILTYFMHFMWFINNPFLGHPLQFVSGPMANIFFVLLYMLIYAFGIMARQRDIPENSFIIASTFFNCFIGFGLFLIITATRFSGALFFDHLIASAIFLGLSIAFWIRERSKYSTFFYAILGYAALSVAIIARFHVPDSFIWLCWQSLLVISTALWFRSKIIVLANFFIFLVIIFSYLLLDRSIGLESLSFGIVALMSARIMNWQRHRLDLKTEFMRNSYLTTAFFMIPFSLYHIFPQQYVSLSWIGVAILYYGISVVLKNKKYRWMALLTLLVSVLYMIIIGIARLEPVLRIISFMVLGIVLLIMSIVYARIHHKADSTEKK